MPQISEIRRHFSGSRAYRDFYLAGTEGKAFYDTNKRATAVQKLTV